MRAVGVANPKAQGQAITKTATAAKIAIVVGEASRFTHGKIFTNIAMPFCIISGNTFQARNVTVATTNTIGTKTAVTLSANS